MNISEANAVNILLEHHGDAVPPLHVGRGTAGIAQDRSRHPDAVEAGAVLQPARREIPVLPMPSNNAKKSTQRPYGPSAVHTRSLARYRGPGEGSTLRSASTLLIIDSAVSRSTTRFGPEQVSASTTIALSTFPLMYAVTPSGRDGHAARSRPVDTTGVSTLNVRHVPPRLTARVGAGERPERR